MGSPRHRRLRRYCYKWRCRNRDGDERVHPRSLEVTKDVIWNGVTPDGTLFEICITGPSYPSGDCKSTTGGVLRWDDLIPGTYTVTESALGSEWEVPVIDDSGATVTSGGVGTATVTNEYILGSLEVTKDVIWNGVTPDGTLFEICITGPSYPSGDCKSTTGGVLRWDDLIPGTYTVTESALGSEWEVPVIDDSGATVTSGGVGTATVTNEYILGSLEVTKDVIWNGVTPDGTLFEICITGPSYPSGDCKSTTGGVLRWDDLIPGTYTVTESALGSEWEVPVIDDSGATVTSGGVGTATVTNEYILGSLEVTKDVIWNGVTPDGTLFEICITGPSYPSGDCKSTTGGVLRWDDLIPGTYTVTESALGSEWEVPSSTTPALLLQVAVSEPRR
ncbi:MSCRAMM family protein [Methanovulcanius yangii]|uniref:MSCRAMM family protein n=1 Tax=Methanovulcanius yangii TaxID=1789227 RepID=UPI0029CA444C|nr:hypothetical protein [Methanovulcanius yangii]